MLKSFLHHVGFRCQPAGHASGCIQCPSNLCGEKQEQVAQVSFILTAFSIILALLQEG